MTLTWKNIAIIFGLMVVAIVVVKYAFPQSIEMDEATKKQKVKTNFLKIPAKA